MSYDSYKWVGQYSPSDSFHPVRVYASEDLAVAYLWAEEGKRVKARTLVTQGRSPNFYSTIYGDATDIALSLDREGYKWDSKSIGFHNCRLNYLRSENSEYIVMPYMDNGYGYTYDKRNGLRMASASEVPSNKLELARYTTGYGGNDCSDYRCRKIRDIVQSPELGLCQKHIKSKTKNCSNCNNQYLKEWTIILNKESKTPGKIRLTNTNKSAHGENLCKECIKSMATCHTCKKIIYKETPILGNDSFFYCEKHAPKEIKQYSFSFPVAKFNLPENANEERLVA
jgi:hypothetical protein